MAYSDPYASKFTEDFSSHLIKDGLVGESALERARSACLNSGERLDRALTGLGLMREEVVVAALASFFGLEMLDQEAIQLKVRDRPEIAAIDTEFFRANRLIPLIDTKDELLLISDDAFHFDALDSLAFWTGKNVRLALSCRSVFDPYFVSAFTAPVKIQNNNPAHITDSDLQRLRDLASEEPMIRLVSEIITEAVGSGASDIHIEPLSDQMRVRYRLDGELVQVRSFSRALQPAILSRFKIMANLDIAEQRLPQDGRIRQAVLGRDIDIRMSSLPIANGESIVLRLLDQERAAIDLTSLGFTPSLRTKLVDLVQQPNGIVLVTGPTGSGKTTTLYAALRTLDASRLNIVTVEDPIEYQIEGINQTQIQPEIGLDFARALRSILRQDPDVILLGEIRDGETARIAVQAALTGHLVISTLHTNNAVASIGRLMDMGIEPYLLSATLRGIVAQRLVRVLCDDCAETTEHEIAFDEASLSISSIGRRPKGCPKCRFTGYRGRKVVAEILPVNEKIQTLIHDHISENEILAQAVASGMLPLKDAVFGLVYQGQTSIEEAYRIAPRAQSLTQSQIEENE